MRMGFKRKNPKNILPMPMVDVGINQSPVSSFVETKLAPAIAKQGKVSFPYPFPLSLFPFPLSPTSARSLLTHAADVNPPGSVPVQVVKTVHCFLYL